MQYWNSILETMFLTPDLWEYYWIIYYSEKTCIVIKFISGLEICNDSYRIKGLNQDKKF